MKKNLNLEIYQIYGKRPRIRTAMKLNVVVEEKRISDANSLGLKQSFRGKMSKKMAGKNSKARNLMAEPNGEIMANMVSQKWWIFRKNM